MPGSTNHLIDDVEDRLATERAQTTARAFDLIARGNEILGVAVTDPELPKPNRDPGSFTRFAAQLAHFYGTHAAGIAFELTGVTIPPITPDFEQARRLQAEGRAMLPYVPGTPR